jgi:hypothetical protein
MTNLFLILYFLISVYDWQLFVEINYIKFNVLIFGVCDEDTREVKLNPLRDDIRAVGDEMKFFNKYSRVAVMASDKGLVTEMEKAWSQGFEQRELVKVTVVL